MKPDRAWCEAVVAHLQPVFDEDGSDWSFHGIADPPPLLVIFFTLQPKLRSMWSARFSATTRRTARAVMTGSTP